MSFPSFCEPDLPQAFADVVQPFWSERVEQGHFIGRNHIQIHFALALHPEPIGSLVISSGRIESLLKYKELVYDFFQAGYSVFIHDHRGQGLSGRMTANPMCGYVEDFADYIADMRQFYVDVVTPQSQHKPMLLCHSMGGAIGTLYVHQYPDDFAKIAMSAPMYGVKPALPGWFARFLLGIHGIVSDSASYFWQQTDYAPEPYTDNKLTTSEVRYQLMQDEYADHPAIQLGGVTGQWLKAAIQAMQNIEQKTNLFPIPALIMQAGNDRIVDNDAHRKVADYMHNVVLKTYRGAEHELLMEQDSIRRVCLTDVLSFFNAA